MNETPEDLATLQALSPHRREAARQRHVPAWGRAGGHGARPRSPLLEVYGQDRADFIDSGPRYARIDAERMFTFHMR